MADGRWFDSWLWWYRAEVGSIVFVDATREDWVGGMPNVGYGPHTHRSGVRYVGTISASGVHLEIRANIVRLADRHWARTNNATHAQVLA